MKVTVWVRSTGGPMIRALHGGDRVRVADGRPGELASTKTVAVRSETCLCLLDWRRQLYVDWQVPVTMGYDGPRSRMAAWQADAPTHQWANVWDAIRQA